jgi:hypothetical protein
MLTRSIIYFFFFLFAHVSTAADSIVVCPSANYQKGIFHEILFGKHYRDLWAKPVTLEVFNIGMESGGLTPVKLGGNFQTKSLRLVNKNGDEFILRSIQKDPSRALSNSILRKSLAGAMMIDQNSSENPYGALIIPPLSKAVGIYTFEPRMVYIPYDEGFGEYTKDFSNTIALFEPRPKEVKALDESITTPIKIVSTKKMLKSVYSDNDDRVDQKMYAKCRLFDMLISDWGRHEDQWRWAEFNKDGRKLYQPIPRDRDHAFYRFDDGVLNWIVRTFLQKKLQSFDNDYDNIKGLNLSANFLDKKFLNKLSLSDWNIIADEIKNNLNDSVIEASVKTWPREIFNEEGEKTISILKARRDQLNIAAQEYYKILSTDVELAGTEQDEHFNIKYLNKKDVLISIYKINKSGERKDTIYHRIFHASETKKIKLFGLDGKDVFEITGDVKNKIKLVLVGGDGEDEFTIKAYPKLPKKTICIIDTKNYTLVNTENRVVKVLTDSISNYYDTKGFKNAREKTVVNKH